MGTLKIKKAQITDAAIIAVLGQVTFMETYRHLFEDLNELIDYCESSFSVQKLERDIMRPNNHFFIAWFDSLPVGYALIKFENSNNSGSNNRMSQLDRIYVLKEFLNKKIGQKLKDALIEKALAEKSDCIWLHVNPENDRAIHFYKKNGFSKIGNDTFSIGDRTFQSMTMIKSLN